MTRIRRQNGILYLGLERCRILDFLFQVRGVGVFQSPYSSIGIIVLGENFYDDMVI